MLRIGETKVEKKEFYEAKKEMQIKSRYVVSQT